MLFVSQKLGSVMKSCFMEIYGINTQPIERIKISMIEGGAAVLVKEKFVTLAYDNTISNVEGIACKCESR